MSILNLFNVYIPTFKRSKEISTPYILPKGLDVYVVCPESQVDEYKKENPDLDFLPCPDSVEGNMAKKRNWIKDNCEKDYFIMIDDDVKHFQMIEGYEQLKMNRNQIINMFEKGFQMMEDLGTVLWGINLNNDKRSYREFMPFSMLAPILGPFTAWKKDNSLRYDERFPTKEDYDMSLQVLHKYHKVLRMNKYSYYCGHLTGQEGGSHSIRTLDMELKQNIGLQKKWGDKVIKYDMEKSVNPRLYVPIKGV